MNSALERPTAARPLGPRPLPAVLRLLPRFLLGTLLFLGLCTWRLVDYYPPLPNPFTFDLALAPGEAGRSDPLIVSGEINRGDFLAVRFDAENTVRFLYDCWGYPGVASTPVTLPADRRLRVRVAMPALDEIHGTNLPDSRRVRVEVNGIVVLDTEVQRYVRTADRIFLGVNPLGGTSCDDALDGTITLPDGRTVQGGVDRIFTRRQRIAGWFTHVPWQALALLIGSVLVAFNVHRLRLSVSTRDRIRTAAVRHRWFIGTTFACSLVFAWLVTLGSFQLNRAEVFGSFYDYQGLSFLHGRLDVPEDAIGEEAFEARGKLYGYFGPTPALLRLPFVATGFAFGKLSRALMLLYFVASLAATYLIFCDALRAARRHRTNAPSTTQDERPSPFAIVVLLASAGLGSTIFFLGSRALIFHEAILGGIAFALWSCWCSLRHLEHPSQRWWLGALVCGVLSIHTRPPTGLFALTLLGCVAVLLAFRDRRSGDLARNIRRHATVAALCFAGLLSLNALAWLKFRTFDAAPLRISRPYKMPGRLDRIDGKSFHLVNLGYNFDAYVLFPNLRLEPGFPWIYLESEKPRRDYPHAKIDLPDHTLALPYSTPGLFWLATLGTLAAVFVLPGTRSAITALWAAALPMSFALFAAIATAQRYTGDFVPFLICAATFGLAATEAGFPRLRPALRTLILLLALAGIAITTAITIHYQGAVVWGVPDEFRANYEQFRHRIDASLK